MLDKITKIFHGSNDRRINVSLPETYHWCCWSHLWQSWNYIQGVEICSQWAKLQEQFVRTILISPMKITWVRMLFSVVVRLEAPDEGLILGAPCRIVTPVNYFQIQDVLFLAVTDGVLCTRVYLTQNKTEKMNIHKNQSRYFYSESLWPKEKNSFTAPWSSFVQKVCLSPRIPKTFKNIIWMTFFWQLKAIRIFSPE